MFSLIWAISAGVAAIAGVLAGARVALDTTSAHRAEGVAAAVLGGFGSISRRGGRRPHHRADRALMPRLPPQGFKDVAA